MADLAHELTDAELTDLEKRIKSAYERAGAEIQRKADKFFADFKKEADRLYAAVTDAASAEERAIAAKAYKDYLTRKLTQGRNITALREKLAADLSAVNQKTARDVASRMDSVFAFGHNYSAYRLEKELGLNLQYDLYDDEKVSGIVKEKPSAMRKPRIDTKKDIAWNVGLIAGAIASGILVGLPLVAIGAAISKVAEVNERSARANAEMSILHADDSGRADAYKHASDIGLDLQKQWVATLDDKTREEHRELDGQIVDIDEPFVVDGIRIMEPRDPDAPGYMVYGCRCDLAISVKGVGDLDPTYRVNNINGAVIKDMTYREWEAARRG